MGTANRLVRLQRSTLSEAPSHSGAHFAAALLGAVAHMGRGWAVAAYSTYGLLVRYATLRMSTHHKRQARPARRTIRCSPEQCTAAHNRNRRPILSPRSSPVSGRGRPRACSTVRPTVLFVCAVQSPTDRQCMPSHCPLAVGGFCANHSAPRHTTAAHNATRDSRNGMQSCRAICGALSCCR